MPFPLPYIAILDVGHGNCTVLRDYKSTIVIDCGAKSSGLLEFLIKEDIKEINKLFISHADRDHIGGLLGLISTGTFTINEVITNSDATKGSVLWNDLLYEMDELNERGEIKFNTGISRSKEFIDCGSIQIETVGPTPYLVGKGVGGSDLKGRLIESNSLSASFRITWQDRSIIYLPGDLDQIGLEDILRHNPNLRSDILVFPHHGGKIGSGDLTSFVESLCDEIHPHTIIFSIGRNYFENPRREIVKIIKGKIKDVRISCTQLSKNCMKEIEFKEFNHLVDVYSKGREDNLCCGGSFIISLNGGLSFYPNQTIHEKFIKSAALSPLCISDN